MPRSQYKHLSGNDVIKVLTKYFGFSVSSQKGSHIKLSSNTNITIVPNHKQLAYGTFKSILELAGITENDFYTNSS